MCGLGVPCVVAVNVPVEVLVAHIVHDIHKAAHNAGVELADRVGAAAGEAHQGGFDAGIPVNNVLHPQQIRKIRLRRAMYHLVTSILNEVRYIVQIFTRGKPTVIPHAPERYSHIRVLADSGFAPNIRQSRSEPAAINGFILHPGRFDTTAVFPNPDKFPGGQRQHLRHGPAEQVGIKAALFQNLYQSNRMAKAVKIDGRGGTDPEFLLKVASA